MLLLHTPPSVPACVRVPDQLLALRQHRQNLCPEAIAVYTEAANGASKLQSAEGRALLAVILANRALCYLKTQQYDNCVTVSNAKVEGRNGC